jgi:UDP-galactopyranose mutase
MRPNSTPCNALLSAMIETFLQDCNVQAPVYWVYSPMWIEVMPGTVRAEAILYDCMDELSGFKGAAERLPENERRLMDMADLVFTGGISLFEAKRTGHQGVHPFPSGVDLAHFKKARTIEHDPEDQRSIARPRIGYAGVIDERLDYDLLREIAAMRPDWQFVMVGPVAKVDPASLPQAENLHWLGMRDYRDLPTYFSQWNVAMMPFALNDATRFISPTKTPEYLAAGLPVVSTPIRDVVRPYGELGLAHIAASAEEFVAKAEEAMAYTMGMKWRERADAFLQSMSWDSVWESMSSLLVATVASKQLSERRHPKSMPMVTGEVARV